MAVDLADLVPALRRAINTPAEEVDRALGTVLFTTQTDSVLEGYLADAFWEGKLQGFYAGYDEDSNIITPESGSTDLSRDWQQLIVIYAALNIIEVEFMNLQTLFRASAGPVEYEVQYSAQLLREILQRQQRRLGNLIHTLENAYSISYGYIDMISARTDSMIWNLNQFESGVGLGYGSDY